MHENNLLKKLRNLGKPNWEKSLLNLGKPTIHLVDAHSYEGFSAMGTTPYVPKDFVWPTKDGKALAFLMQIRFSEINGGGEVDDLPTSGLLYVFYDADQEAWGDKPSDKGSWKLLFFKETDAVKMRRYPKDLNLRYKVRKLKSQVITTVPSAGSPEVEALDIDYEQYCNYVEGLYGEENPKHQLGGYAFALQSDEMETECVETVDPPPAANDDAWGKAVSERAKEWILLLQIDTDYQTEMDWVDTGMLYFWIRKKDLAQRNFDDVWMILQSY
jgi:uncharacterized protein YwqG